MKAVGGEKYAALTSLVYRQVCCGPVLLAHVPPHRVVLTHRCVFLQVLGSFKMTVDDQGMPWNFVKEISSDGDIQTVDVLYPACPLLLLLAPNDLSLALKPVMEYAMNRTSRHYPFVFAPHHLGIYPIADIRPVSVLVHSRRVSSNSLLISDVLGGAGGAGEHAGGRDGQCTKCCACQDRLAPRLWE